MGNPLIHLSAVETWGVEPLTGIRLSRSVADLTPYEAANRAGAPTPTRTARIFKLDWNEATISPSPLVAEAIQNYMTADGGLNWYPELGSEHLRTKLAEYTGRAADSILVTNGSDEGLQLICNTYLDPGDVVLAPVPTYQHFIVFAQARGATIRTVQSAHTFTADIAAVREAMDADVRLVYLVSPNNPTGAMLDPADVARLCAEYPSTLFLLDEAYYEFSGVTGMDLIATHPNLIVTRTFSKAFGLAGLRVGYLSASDMVLDGLRRLYNSKSVNTLGQIGAAAALDDLDYLDDFVQQVHASKTRVCEFFAQRGVEALDTRANFIVIKVSDVVSTVEKLVGEEIYVRDRSSYPGMEGCIRMTLGTVAQTERLLTRLERVFG